MIIIENKPDCLIPEKITVDYNAKSLLLALEHIQTTSYKVLSVNRIYEPKRAENGEIEPDLTGVRIYLIK
jgi:hypothetical protein